MIFDQNTTEARVAQNDIAEVLDDIAAVDRLTSQQAATGRRHDRLQCDGYSETDIDQMNDMRRECRQALTTAMGCCEAVFIDRGTVAFRGTRASEFAGRIAKFNNVVKPHSRSFAALCLTAIVTEDSHG